MKKKKKKNNTAKVIIIIAIVLLLLIILSILGIVFGEKNKEIEKAKENEIKVEEYENSIARFKEFASDYEKQTILPRNISVLYKYEGIYERDDFYKNIKLYTDYLSYLSESVDSSNIESFYNQYSEEIEKVTGNVGLDEFADLINKLQGKNVNVSQLRYAEVEKQSTTTEDGYFRFVINVYYGEEDEEEGNLEKLSINVFWAEDDSKEKEFIYELK